MAVGLPIDRPLPAEHAWYLYGIAARPSHATDAVDANADIGGIAESHPVVAVACADLVAFVSAVPVAQFAPEPLNSLAQDSAWLERIAREHRRVLGALHRRCTTAPVMLCSIVPSEDAVCASLAQSRASILSTLRRLDGCDEFGIQIVAERPRLEDLAARSSENMGARGVDELIEGIARSSFAELEAVSSDAQILALADNRSDAAGRLSLLRAAVLVERVRQPDLLATLERLRRTSAGIEVECAGPWPPYDFVESDAFADATVPA